MALVWCDGFEGYGTGNNTAPAPTGVLADKYRYVSQEDHMRLRNDTTHSGSGWAFSYAYQTSDDPVATTRDVVTGNTTIAGAACRLNNQQGLAAYHTWPLLSFKNDDAEKNAAIYYAQGNLWVSGPDRLFLGGCRVTFTRYKWQYVEMKVYHHATNGTIEVRVNGCPVINVTSVNTTANTSKASTRVCLGDINQIQTSRYLLVDDFYVCDGSGSKNNDFLGPVYVETLWAASDDVVQFTKTGNANYTTHYEQLIRTTRDGSTDYVLEDTVNSIDQFGMDNASTFNTIHGVAVWGAVNYTTTTANYQFRLTSNGSTTEGAVTAAPSSTNINTFIVENDPSTNAAFTSNALDNIITGIKVAP